VQKLLRQLSHCPPPPTINVGQTSNDTKVYCQVKIFFQHWIGRRGGSNHRNRIVHHYLFKKFLVSDWLIANCEIVISTQWLTKYGFFAIILAKWRQRVNMKKIWTRLRHITMMTRIILTRWRHWYDDDDGCRRTKELFFLNTNKIQMFWIFKINNKTIIEFGLRTIWRIIKPSVCRYQPQRFRTIWRIIKPSLRAW
jgi:hypothetical protein